MNNFIVNKKVHIFYLLKLKIFIFLYLELFLPNWTKHNPLNRRRLCQQHTMPPGLPKYQKYSTSKGWIMKISKLIISDVTVALLWALTKWFVCFNCVNQFEPCITEADTATNFDNLNVNFQTSIGIQYNNELLVTHCRQCLFWLRHGWYVFFNVDKDSAIDCISPISCINLGKNEALISSKVIKFVSLNFT